MGFGIRVILGGILGLHWGCIRLWAAVRELKIRVLGV